MYNRKCSYSAPFYCFFQVPQNLTIYEDLNSHDPLHYLHPLCGLLIPVCIFSSAVCNLLTCFALIGSWFTCEVPYDFAQRDQFANLIIESGCC